MLTEFYWDMRILIFHDTWLAIFIEYSIRTYHPNIYTNLWKYLYVNNTGKCSLSDQIFVKYYGNLFSSFTAHIQYTVQYSVWNLTNFPCSNKISSSVQVNKVWRTQTEMANSHKCVCVHLALNVGIFQSLSQHGTLISKEPQNLKWTELFACLLTQSPPIYQDGQATTIISSSAVSVTLPWWSQYLTHARRGHIICRDADPNTILQLWPH
jgi:hypothetical protein